MWPAFCYLGGETLGHESLGDTPVDVIKSLDDSGLDRMPSEATASRLGELFR